MYLQTERLVLRSFQDGDLPSLTQLLRDPEIAKTYMLPEYSAPDRWLALARRFQQLSREPDRCVGGIFRKDTLVGFFNDVEIRGREMELGYAVAPGCWNRGYATEALAALIAELHSRGVERVITGAFEENTASIRVMVKAGMRPEDRVDTVEYRGVRHRCVYYRSR